MAQFASEHSHNLPLSGCVVRFLDVDHNGVTADGERFDIEPKVYRGHFYEETAVLRYPDGTLKLVQRIVPAKQAV